MQRAIIRQLSPGVYLIDDAGESTCYLICGSVRALLIDTLNGEENLAEIIRTLTDLPVTVVNTHGHCDHVYGNVFFEEAWLHPADEKLMAEHFGFIADRLTASGLRPCPTRPLSIGQVFDLGGTVLEVVDLSGHTAGSVGLLDRAARVLYSGDGLNPHLWMQLAESLPIARLRETLLALKARCGGDFDRVLTGHAGTTSRRTSPIPCSRPARSCSMVRPGRTRIMNTSAGHAVSIPRRACPASASFTHRISCDDRMKPTMKKLNIGIVGAGRIGKVHAASITYHIPQAQVVRVTDVVTEATKALAETYGVPA